ncbi:MAG: SRPBCC family protein [Candidatus Binatia bacterium]
MNKKAVIGGIVAVLVVVVGFGVYKAVSLRSEAAKWSGPVKEIVEEDVTHDNNVTHTRFVSLVDAPIAKVQKVLWDVENSQKTVKNIKLSKLLESKGNTKLVEINLQALTLPLQNFTMRWTLYPNEHRITFKTVKSQVQEIDGQYQLEPSPDGNKTRIVYTTTSKDKIAVPFPQSVLDSASRETYVNTVRGIEKAIKQG